MATMHSDASSPFIDRLSLELQQMILCQLGDVLSLRSAALTCRALYHAVLSAETLITTRVWLEQVGIDALPEACLALEAARGEPHSQETARKFIETHLQKRAEPAIPWALSSAIPMAKLCVCVTDLASRFIEACATKTNILSSSPPSTEEVSRIRQALYRFEIFCSLFRLETNDGGPGPDLVNAYFSCFSPWEIEQLACVHDFLVRVVAPAFNDVAEHDILWGVIHVESIEFVDNFDTGHIQHVLSLGLQKLRLISMTAAYKERYELLEGSKPVYRSMFLHEALTILPDPAGDMIFTETTAAEIRNQLTTFFVDSDGGPFEAWMWANQDESFRSVYREEHAPLRQWGYVMWDRQRLANNGIFDSRWERPETSQEDMNERTRRRAEIELSWEQREVIATSGGWGWWSLADHSKIIWPERKSQPAQYRRRAPSRFEPKTLEEARDGLRTFDLPLSVRRRLGG
ncbi:hypothetical protein M011DRAFT_488120 [Sporormia fimetaria CBS 119925]|uniref:F-box domain-containing protein n=1 Tax=Sporormia fimetaria CBS 119925 TaxID=1340428 RepID=A0A6A6V8P2_9PLEO|nr:hypothetical protein M011DRAFT_488120 [Sporormia fimetaria CBS 119925]